MYTDFQLQENLLQHFSATSFFQTLFLWVTFYPDKFSQKMIGGEFLPFSP